MSGYRAEFGVVPSASMTVAVLCNVRTAGPYTLKNRILDVYLSDRLAAAGPTSPAAPAALPAGSAGSSLVSIPLKEIGDLPGTYFSEELDVRWKIKPGATNGILLQRRNLPAIELVPRDTVRTRFTVIGAPVEVRFERDVSSQVTGFVVDFGDITGIRFVKLK